MRTATALVATIASLAAATSALATGPGDAKELLKKADEATKNVEAVSYHAKREGTGAMAARVPIAKGEMLIVKNLEDDNFPAKGHADGKTWNPGSRDATAFNVAYNGKNGYSLDEKTRTLTIAPADEGGADLIGPGQNIFMLEFAHPTPFQDEINAELAEHEGQVIVGDVLCDVIYVEYGGMYGDSKARWYFGVEDHLPRRVERLNMVNDRPGAAVLTLTSLKVDPDYTSADLMIKAPAGYETKTYERPSAPARPELLAVGSKAPNWSLEDPSGKTHDLADYRGKIVLMDFWATWCGPCKRAMPGVQALHEKFSGQDVAVLGINCWESEDGDPAAYMADQGYTYGLLLGADEVAEEYHVSGIPTFYLIGKDGTVIHREVGFAPDKEEKLAKIIEEHLKKSGGA